MKSTKSNSSKEGLETPVTFVKGVGPRLATVFASKGIHTVGDLLAFFPRDYENRTEVASGIQGSSEGERISIWITIQALRKIPIHRGRKSMLEARCVDSAGEPMALKWFHAPWGIDKKLKPGERILVRGTVKTYNGRREILHPEMEWGAADSLIPENQDSSSAHFGRIVPIYTEIEGISTRIIRQILWNALGKFLDFLKEDLPPALLRAHSLPSLKEAYREIHFPKETDDLEKIRSFQTPWQSRLIYEEFLKFELMVLMKRIEESSTNSKKFPLGNSESAVKDLLKDFPFQLTGDQEKALKEILVDLSSSQGMNRLLQGDVGSGKTAVAFLAAGAVISGGDQVALMAPTEILAEQHYANALKMLSGKFPILLLTGSTSAAERKEILKKISSGEPLLLIGTHALVEESVRFRALSLAIIDEQHRFGVDQRRALRTKSGDEGKEPHLLVLSATPIPRTLALTAYGDLQISTIKEKPPGRKPVKTHIVRSSWRDRAFERIRSELQNGRQAYFIYPLIQTSEAEGFQDMKSAIQESERIAKNEFPEFPLALLHGQMKPEDKEAAMARFQTGEAKILVSTTVVEVGVDVPNATIMAIEHAERFGLSQLHQLRGRVGRGSHESYCFLFPEGHLSDTAKQRLSVLEKTEDGFLIAEADLEIRGPGEFLGTRQSGGLPFRIGNLVRDREWILRAREDAESILRLDPTLNNQGHAGLKTYFAREGNIQFDRLKTS